MQYLTSPNKPTRAKSFYGEVKTTTDTVVYTCPANCTAELTFLHITNASTSNTATIRIYVAALAYTSQFLTAKTLSNGEYVTSVPMQIFLSAGDQIKVQTTNAGHIDIIGSVVETFIPVG
jgi:hypothetical protein